MTDNVDKDVELPPEAFGYLKGHDTITETHADNSLKVYEVDLGFSREQLAGKTVLDLGTGTTDRLARELKEADIDTNVVSLSPDLHTSTGAKYALELEHPGWRRRGVSGIAQRLPFQDNSFDMILGLYSVTYYTWSESQMQAWVREFARTLKPGGEVRLGPAYTDNVHAFGKDFEKIKHAADSVNLSFSAPIKEGHPEYLRFVKLPIK